jgi:hypothetical protein
LQAITEQNHFIEIMKKTILLFAFLVFGVSSFAQSNVYFTSEITPESLVEIFEALGVTPSGSVALKISTGESAQSNYLRPEFIRNLVEATNATIVECNTAVRGRPRQYRIAPSGHC